MVTKGKRISINALTDAVNTMGDTETVVCWNGLEINVKRFLSLKEMSALVSKAVSDCINPDTGEYRPEMRDFSVGRCMLICYTNLSLPVNVEKQYELIVRSNLPEIISGYIDKGQWFSIETAINDKIEIMTDAHIAAVEKQLAEAAAILNQVNELFSGVQNADLSKIVSAITEGRMDEEKLVKAYMEQKGNQQEAASESPAIEVVK